MAMPLDLWRLNCLLCVQGDDGDVEEMEVDLRSKIKLCVGLGEENKKRLRSEE